MRSGARFVLRTWRLIKKERRFGNQIEPDRLCEKSPILSYRILIFGCKRQKEMSIRKGSWCFRGSVGLITVSKNSGLHERELKRYYKDTWTYKSERTKYWNS